MNYLLQINGRSPFKIKIVLVFGLVFLTGCGNDTELGNLPLKNQKEVMRSGTPVPLKADKENKGKRCEVKGYLNYYDPEEGTPEYKRCTKLQKELNQAALNGDLEGIRKALERGANVNAGYYQEGPPLGMAITKEGSEAVLLLVENGAEVNFDYNFGSTPLKRAVYYNFPEIAKVLVDNGADLCSKKPDDFGHELTPLDIAKQKGNQELIELLKTAGGENCP